MGIYINPGNEAFRRIAGPNYVDKTLLCAEMNRKIESENSLVCISRPRRFGKSFAAKMLAAYYDCSCNSHDLFDNKKIGGTADYTKHLNQYNVLCLDITGFVSVANMQDMPLSKLPNLIEKTLLDELSSMNFDLLPGRSFTDNLTHIAERKNGKKFVFIIDEWDAVIREAKNDPLAQKNYLEMLRSWFKNTNFTPKVVAAAYMTGILPIKKNGSQSAISDFREYSILEPGGFAEFFGFTEDEVKEICARENLDFEEAKQWYDGYTIGDLKSMYNPYSLMEAVDKHKFKSYWKRTSAAESLQSYIDMDQDGLQADVAALIAGESIEVRTDSFRNDFETFTCKDDVLTLMIHLGYLSFEYEEDNIGYASIPNEEIRSEFDSILRKAKHKELIDLVRRSDELLQRTIAGDSEAVAQAFEQIHSSSYAPTFYNNEQALRYAIKMAYISCVDQYARVEELPSGRGLADVVYLPRKRSGLPPMVIEMKWNQSSAGAIGQIRTRDYAKLPAELAGDVVLVGVNYDEKTKTHSCQIERTTISR